MNSEVYLKHYGILGMHWGIKKTRQKFNAKKDYIISVGAKSLAGLMLSPVAVGGSYFIARKAGVSMRNSMRIASVSGVAGAIFVHNKLNQT